MVVDKGDYGKLTFSGVPLTNLTSWGVGGGYRVSKSSLSTPTRYRPTSFKRRIHPGSLVHLLFSSG